MSNEHKKVGNRLYFMNDKNIRDGLVAHKVKAEHLIKLFLDKGIIVPTDCSKEALLDLIQTMRFDYHDYLYLSSILESHDKRDSQSTTELPVKTSVSNITTAANAAKTSLSKDEIDLSINMTGKKVTIDVSYIDVDFSKAPMRQRTPRKGTIEIDISNNDETSIRFPSTDIGKKVKEKILFELNKQFTNPVEAIEIDFQHSTAEKRTAFFTKLITLPGYDVEDVVNVNVRNALGEDEESDAIGLVRKAALSGKVLLTSDVYNSFSTGDYNIYKIVWKIRKVEPATGSNQSDCFTVEAKFDDIINSKGFSYQVKSVQRYNNSRSNLNATSVKPEKNEVDLLAKLIYKTAVGIYSELT